jgi:hypothetical protein
MDWFPTFVAAAGNPNITAELLKGKQMGGQTYKVHLDGYYQTALISMARVHFVRGRKMGHVTQVGTIPPKTLMGAKVRIWPLKAGAIGFPPVDIPGFGWYIRALKVKGSAFRQPFALPEFQSDQLKRMPRAGSRSR